MIKFIFLKIIKFYKQFISPFLGYHCKFYPTCSEYFSQAMNKYGVIIGSWKGIRRIFKCNPFHKGGIDLP